MALAAWPCSVEETLSVFLTFGLVGRIGVIADGQGIWFSFRRHSRMSQDAKLYIDVDNLRAIAAKNYKTVSFRLIATGYLLRMRRRFEPFRDSSGAT